MPTVTRHAIIPDPLDRDGAAARLRLAVAEAMIVQAGIPNLSGLDFDAADAVLVARGVYRLVDSRTRHLWGQAANAGAGRRPVLLRVAVEFPAVGDVPTGVNILRVDPL